MRMKIKNKKIVVTGGAGFIGSNLSEELARENEVVIIDNFVTGKRENIADIIKEKNLNLVEDTVTNLELLQRVFNGVDYVFHEAAIPSVPRSVEDPVASNNANINGTLNVLIAARDNNVKKVVYASSSSVYGDTPTSPKVETMKPTPLSPYAITKLAGEYYCKVFYEIYGLKTTSLRYFNVYGPKQDPLSEYAAVVPRFMTRVLEGKPPVIYGDGEQTRDFTFIKDVVLANILVAVSKKANGEAINIAGGKRITVNDLAVMIIEMLDGKQKPEYANPRKGDIRHSLADISKAKRLLDYQPMYDLKKGLHETCRYFSDRNSHYS